MKDQDRQRLERAVAFLESTLFLPRKLISSVVEDLLTQYGGWAHIEADNFHLLVDSCFQRMEEEATTFSKVKASSVEWPKSKSSSEEALNDISENFAQERSYCRRPRRLKRVGVINTRFYQTANPDEGAASSVLVGATGVDLTPSSVKVPRAGTSMETVGAPFQARLPRRASTARKSPYTEESFTPTHIEVDCQFLPELLKSEVGPVQGSVAAANTLRRDRAAEPGMELNSPQKPADGGGSIHSGGQNKADTSLHGSLNGDNSRQTCSKAGLVMVKEKPRALSFIAEYYDEESS